MYSLIVSMIVFLATVLVLFFAQLRPHKRRQAKLHDITLTTSNIVRLAEKRAAQASRPRDLKQVAGG